MQRFTSLLTARTLTFAAAGLLILVGGVYLIQSAGAPKEQLLTVQKEKFVQAVAVSGKVTAVQDADLGFAQTGRVAQLRARVGEHVSRGEVLASLDNGDASAAVAQKRAGVENQKAKLAQLLAGTRPESVAVSEASAAAATVTLERANQALLDALRDASTKSDDAIRNKVDQFFNNPLTDPKLSFQLNDPQLKIRIESDRALMEARLRALHAAVGSLSASDDQSSAVSKARDSLSVFVRFLSDANSALNVAIPSGDITQTKIDGYITDVATGRTNLNTASAAITTAVTTQENAAAALVTAQKNLALAKAPPTQADIDAQQAQVSAAAADLESAQAQLSKTLIVAPFGGTVTKVDIKVGEVASANASSISMQSDGTFQIESYVPEVNIALVRVGDAAEVTLDAYGDAAPFSAHVISIDPAETVRDGVSTYRSLLSFDAKDDRVRSGMTANVRITTRDEEGILSIPQRLVSERDGAMYVTVKADGQKSEREVTVGGVSVLGNVEIRSGLSEGDVVVISP